jgi:hypothetical protein
MISAAPMWRNASPLIKACGGTLVLLEDPADLPVHRRLVEAFL